MAKGNFNFDSETELFGGFGFGGASDRRALAPADDDPGDGDAGDAVTARKARRRTKACTELSQRYEYRRAFSEVSLLDAMRHVRLADGVTYNFITGGDVDSLSYLKVVLNQHDLDFCLLSTWCMSAEDVLQVQEWYGAGRIRHVDMYLGEKFPDSYKVEWEMVRKFYGQHPEAGRAAVFRNHSKIYAGCNEADGFYFGIQTSANINTNPRTEQGSITVSRGIYEFYREYFDGIRSFVK